MAYYTKEEVKKFVNEKNDIIVKNNRKPITPIEEPISQLEIENDVVGFFWVEFNDQGDGNVEIKMKGKTFIRIDTDLYTDDRYAIDLHHAQLEGTTVSEIIKTRLATMAKAKTTISIEEKEDMQNKIQEQIKKQNKKEA